MELFTSFLLGLLVCAPFLILIFVITRLNEEQQFKTVMTVAVSALVVASCVFMIAIGDMIKESWFG